MAKEVAERTYQFTKEELAVIGQSLNHVKEHHEEDEDTETPQYKSLSLLQEQFEPYTVVKSKESTEYQGDDDSDQAVPNEDDDAETEADKEAGDDYQHSDEE